MENGGKTVKIKSVTLQYTVKHPKITYCLSLYVRVCTSGDTFGPNSLLCNHGKRDEGEEKCKKDYYHWSGHFLCSLLKEPLSLYVYVSFPALLSLWDKSILRG